MEMLIIKENSPEYNYMWNWLASHPINEGFAEPMVAFNDGEAWQYMGTYKQGTKALHEFRHRNHPSNNDRVSLKVNASENMNDEDIESKHSMK